jgi:hypothetical protein
MDLGSSKPRSRPKWSSNRGFNDRPQKSNQTSQHKVIGGSPSRNAPSKKKLVWQRSDDSLPQQLLSRQKTPLNKLLPTTKASQLNVLSATEPSTSVSFSLSPQEVQSAIFACLEAKSSSHATKVRLRCRRVAANSATGPVSFEMHP